MMAQSAKARASAIGSPMIASAQRIIKLNIDHCVLNMKIENLK